LLIKIAKLKDEDKNGHLSFIQDIVDESDRNGIRAVIKLKRDTDAKKVLAYLYKTTDLEASYGINMVAIANGKPCQLGLLDIISYYVNYQREVVLRRSKFDLERAKERAHVLEGLIVAVQNIDEVIKIIKKAENTSDARAKLRERFGLTEVQATAILDLRLAFFELSVFTVVAILLIAAYSFFLSSITKYQLFDCYLN
jgi:DNA gyrase subunit A